MTNEQLTKYFMDLSGQVSGVNESIKNLVLRVRQLEEANEEHKQILVFIERLTNHMGTVTQKVESLDRKLDSVGDRIGTIEKRPGTLWDKAVAFVLGAVLTGVVTYFLQQLL